MKTAYIRWMWLLGLLFAQVVTLFAQDGNVSRCERIYEQLTAGQGDSIHAGFSKELQTKISPAVFNDSFKQVEVQFGKLQSKGEWKQEVVQGITIYYSDLQFERFQLRLLMAFDADGRTNTIRFVPVPAAAPVAPSVDKSNADVEEREITVGSEGFKLPGTLTLPKSSATEKRKFPLVILVHGSGPQDRDETIGPNKPFRDLAWGLAERGVAVIRYEKRTKQYGANCVPTGREMDYEVETVDDAVAAVALAKTLPEVTVDSIYVLGHSLGGTLAPQIAQQSKGLAGIIIVAGLARPLEDALLEQVEYISSLTDSSTAAKAPIMELKKQVSNMKKLGTAGFDSQIPLPLGLPHSYWQFAIRYKPVVVAAKQKLPIFVLQGERDYQVTMQDFSLWRSGLSRSKKAAFKSYPKLNHLLHEGSGKATPSEYNRASSVAGYVMDDIVSFIRTSEL